MPGQAAHCVGKRHATIRGPRSKLGLGRRGNALPGAQLVRRGTKFPFDVRIKEGTHGKPRLTYSAPIPARDPFSLILAVE
jgi:hypothetical protein